MNDFPVNAKEILWYSIGYPLEKLGATRATRNKSNAVLTFHSIGDGYYDNVTLEAFKRLLDLLQARYRFVDLDQILTSRSDDKRICLTFDDGYAGFYSNVLPALRNRQIPATVFIIARSLTDTSFCHNQQYNYKYMSITELKELREDELVTIGNHTMTHPDLTNISDDNRLKREIIESKNILEKELNISINRFCYPGNKYNKRCHSLVKKSHKYAVRGGGRTSKITSKTDPHRIPRINGAKDPWQVEWDMSDLSKTFARTIRSKVRDAHYTK